MISVIEVSDLAQAEVTELLESRSLDNSEAEGSVREIVSRVRQEGDSAVLAFTERFDKVAMRPSDLRVDPDEIEAALRGMPEGFVKALDLARERIIAYHQKQRRRSMSMSRLGGMLLELTRPLARVGAYVPGGTASYPSSVLMNVLPAQVAGVEEIAVFVPPAADGNINAPTLAAASRAGVTEIYKVGGAQAIAAMAYGTETIKRVDKITGPGNLFVTLAKKQLQGVVGIDMIAGPSEIVVLADETANPVFVAADMLGQAEHDSLAMSVLVTTSKGLAESVKVELRQQAAGLKRRDIAEQSLDNHGAIFICPTVEFGLDLVNLIAPEHLEIMLSDVGSVKEITGKVKNAGAIFLGHWTPEAVGDYVAGPNHVLPTSGTARFYSPLGVDDFLKKSHVVLYSKKGLKKVSREIITLAELEGLEAHARSVELRLNG
ncbi:MAG: histidinol dehydrogenase [Terriglobia bacterium]